MKEKILDTAARLISQYGLKKFTVNDLAAELRISKKTIYQYFESKDAIIREYFDTAIESDKESIISAISGSGDFSEKIYRIVYSSHRYRLTVSLLMEAKKFYPDEWSKVEGLKQFKLDAVRNLFQQGVEADIFKPDVHFGVLSEMLEKISNIFTDYDFLLENRMNTREAINEALKIIFGGIMKVNQ